MKVKYAVIAIVVIVGIVAGLVMMASASGSDVSYNPTSPGCLKHTDPHWICINGETKITFNPYVPGCFNSTHWMDCVDRDS